MAKVSTIRSSPGERPMSSANAACEPGQVQREEFVEVDRGHQAIVVCFQHFRWNQRDATRAFSCEQVLDHPAASKRYLSNS